MFMMGLDMLTKYINLKDKKYLILSLVAIGVGLLLIFNPGSVIFTYLKIAGVYLILVALLSFSSILKKKEVEE